MRENSPVYLMRENSQVSLMRENSQVSIIRENSQVSVMRENSQVSVMRGNSQVSKMRENSQVSVMCENSQVSEMWGNSQVSEMRENSISKIYSKFVKIKYASENSIIIFYDIKKIKFKHSRNVKIIETNTIKHINKITDYFTKEEIKNKKVELIKIVDNDYYDFYIHTVKYEVGKIIECPDWKDTNEIECGNALHLSKTIQKAKKYNKPGKILKCEVLLSDMRVYKYGYQDKFRCKKVKVLEEIK